MDKNAVTRTFSIGAICSGTKASDDAYAARRHSSAGIRALLWATSGAKSLGSSLGSETRTSRENIFPNILTPDSIPQFTIPSLSVQNGLRAPDRELQEDYSESEEGSGCSVTEPDSSASSPGLGLVPSDRRAERSVSDPLSQRRSYLQREGSYPCSYTEAQHCLDPASRAALSLPHLAKVTTPYGFVTLGQSPQMASEEWLLCRARLQRSHRDEEAAFCPSEAPGTRTVEVKGYSSQLTADRQKLCGRSQDAGSVQEELNASSGSSKRKQRVYAIIRKHFTSLGMKS